MTFSRSRAIAASISSEYGQVAHDRQVGRRLEAGEQRGEVAPTSSSGAPSVEHLLRRVLGLLDVGLVERVDLQHPADDGGRELGQEEHAPEVVGPARLHGDRRVAGLGERGDAPRRARRPARRCCGDGGTRGRCRRRRRSASGSSATGRMPRPCLPVLSAISCSTQTPNERDRVVDHERQLVAAGARELAEREAEPQAGVVLGVLEVRARLLGDLRALEQRPDVDARQRGRHEPEVRQRRVAPADLGVVLERAAEAVLLGEVEQRWSPGSVIEHEVRAVALQRVEVLEQRDRLDRPAGLGGDEEQRLREVDLALDGLDLQRLGGVEHVQAQPALVRRRRRGGRPRARGSSRPCRAARRRSARRPCTPRGRRRARRPPRAACRRSSASRGGR